jgi:hypothetical protein
MWSWRNTLPLGNAPLLSLQRLLDSDLVLIRATMVDEFGSIYSEMQPDSDDYDGSIGASSRCTALFTTKVIDQLVAVAGRKAVLPQVSHLQLLSACVVWFCLGAGVQSLGFHPGAGAVRDSGVGSIAQQSKFMRI